MNAGGSHTVWGPCDICGRQARVRVMGQARAYTFVGRIICDECRDGPHDEPGMFESDPWENAPSD